MARWENEDVSDLNIPDPVETNTTYVGLQGKETTEEQALAKSAISSDGSKMFYIKYGRNEILDPYQIDSSFAGSRRQRHVYKFKKVTEETFDNYKKYLETKNRIFFTKARRFLMEN
jgi:hypothetical protein|tara:strand:+ start:2933 stop:3280 length:348 start_codon:yes stop_codon:yes gene_type:complete